MNQLSFQELPMCNSPLLPSLRMSAFMCQSKFNLPPCFDMVLKIIIRFFISQKIGKTPVKLGALY